MKDAIFTLGFGMAMLFGSAIPFALGFALGRSAIKLPDGPLKRMRLLFAQLWTVPLSIAAFTMAAAFLGVADADGCLVLGPLAGCAYGVAGVYFTLAKGRPLFLDFEA